MVHSRFLSFLKSLVPGSRYYQVAGGHGFLHLRLTVLKRKFDPALHGWVDGIKGVPWRLPPGAVGLTPTESKIKDFVGLTCNQNLSHRNKLLRDLFSPLHRTQEELYRITHATKDALENKKKEFLNVNGKMTKDAPDINTAFERVRQAYEKLCHFRNENFIESEKEIDLSSFRLVYPIVLAFAVLMEMVYTGFQLAPALGLGRAYGQFGGFSILMAFLAYEAGHYCAYYRGFVKKRGEWRRRYGSAVNEQWSIKEFLYLPTMAVCLVIMLVIMGFNFFRLPAGDRMLVLLWVLFCFFAFLHGVAGEKYPGHRNHIVLFRKELAIFKQIVYFYIDQLKTIKQQFDMLVATTKEGFSGKIRFFKDQLDRVRSIETSYQHCLREVLKDATSLYEIYYHSNAQAQVTVDHSTSGYNYQQRLAMIREKLAIENYQGDEATRRVLDEAEGFYRAMVADGTSTIDKIAEGADEENKTLLTIYNKKLHDVSALVATIKIPSILAPAMAGNREGGEARRAPQQHHSYQSPVIDKESEFQVIMKTIADAERNIEKDH